MSRFYTYTYTSRLYLAEFSLYLTINVSTSTKGNMWAQSWLALEEEMRPYPNKTGLDVTDELIRQVSNVSESFILIHV